MNVMNKRVRGLMKGNRGIIKKVWNLGKGYGKVMDASKLWERLKSQ